MRPKAAASPTEAVRSRPPRVRVGIVLPQDGATRVSLRIPPQRYVLRNASSRIEIDGNMTSSLTACADGSAVVLSLGGDRLGRSGAWTLAPRVERDDVGVICHDCVAGRGFHWSTRIDLQLPGAVELTVRDGLLLVVNALPIETYLQGVITAEMSGLAPVEFLKAQCVVARSWLIAAAERKHADLGIDLCNDDCCQRYQGIAAVTPSARQAVEETAGRVLMHERGAVVDANYSKSCGGIVETPQHVWSVAKAGLRCVVDAPDASDVHRFLPVHDDNIAEYVRGDWLRGCDAYCSPRVVPDASLPRYLGRVDDGGGHFRWTVTYDAGAFNDLLRRKLFDENDDARPDPVRHAPEPDGVDGARFHDLVVTRRGRSGRATRVAIVYDDRRGRRRTRTIDDQHRIRHVLHDAFLYSSAFDVRIDRDAGGRPVRITLHGAGWGHGAGLCQIGALGMALQGCDARRILHHYFENVTVTRYEP